MEEIHKIRVKLYEEEKSLTTEEKIIRSNQITKYFLKKYHLENRLLKSVSIPSLV